MVANFSAIKVSRNDRKDEERKERITSITGSLGFAAIACLPGRGALFLSALRETTKLIFITINLLNRNYTEDTD